MLANCVTGRGFAADSPVTLLSCGCAQVVNCVVLLTVLTARKEWPLPFALVYLVPLILWYGANHGYFYGLFFLIFVTVPIMEVVVGADESNPTSQEAALLNANPVFKWITMLWVPAQLTLLVWAW